MIVERALPFDHQLSCTIIEYHRLSFSLSLLKFFMIVDDSFSRLTTRMIVHDSFSVSCFGNRWPDSGQKTCCRPLSSRKIHTFTSLSYGTPFSIRIFYASINSSGAHPPPPRATVGHLLMLSVPGVEHSQIYRGPGGWALAYPGATPGYLTHMFSKDR